MAMPFDKPLERRRIMVVDDQKFIRGLVSQGLRGMGAEVVEAADGFEAITILGVQDHLNAAGVGFPAGDRSDVIQPVAKGRQQFDAIVTDIRMGPMNGLEMLKAIRAGLSHARRDLPVIIMSAHSDEALIAAAIALDAHGFVTKPVSQKLVADRLKRSFEVTVPLKEADDYRLLIIPDLEGLSLAPGAAPAGQAGAVIRAADVIAASGHRTLKLRWQDLDVGDVLAENFATRNGRLIAPVGTRVTHLLTVALADLADLTELMEMVAVRRKN